jgi:hypothetical protein
MKEVQILKARERILVLCAAISLTIFLADALFWVLPFQIRINGFPYTIGFLETLLFEALLGWPWVQFWLNHNGLIAFVSLAVFLTSFAAARSHEIGFKRARNETLTLIIRDSSDVRRG